MKQKRRGAGPALAAALLGALALAAAVFFKPMPALEDKSLLASDAAVLVTAGPAGLGFVPAGGASAKAAKSTGLAFYCGARVPPEAYAYLARACARAGYTSILLSMPLNLAFLAPSRAAAAAVAYPAVTRWVIAGHSLGGVVAASFVAGAKAGADPAGVGGLLLLAAYPGREADLSTKTLPVVTVGASRDALATPEKIAAAEALLPAGSRYVEIAGGNHAQFGEYGPQPGDGAAEISGPTQREAAVEEAIGLLDRVEAGAAK
jgi:hypothetical protein